MSWTKKTLGQYMDDAVQKPRRLATTIAKRKRVPNVEPRFRDMNRMHSSPFDARLPTK